VKLEAQLKQTIQQHMGDATARFSRPVSGELEAQQGQYGRGYGDAVTSFSPIF